MLPAAANQRPAAHSAHPLAHRASPRGNILLITIDTLRADHLGCYGYKNIHTPTIDALARDGVLFPMAISQVPLTLPSHAAILTGTYPFHNGLQDFTAPPLSEKFRTLAEAFRDHGYATGAAVSSFVLDRSWGLARGFDYYDDKFNAQSFLEKNPALVERRADASVNVAIAWLAGHRSRPFFFWLHLYDPHSPYDPPEPFYSQYRHREYDGEIAYTDSQLARLIAWLKRAGLYTRTSILLLSDHGESLGEHGEQEHGFFIYNSTVHVPLIIKPAAQSRYNLRTISTPVETIAVAPTMLQMAGISDRIQQQFDSAGLFAADSPKLPTSAYSETFYPFSSFGWSPLHGLETEKYHYIDAPKSELYSVKDDAADERDIATAQGAVASVLKSELQKRIQEHAPHPAPLAGGSLDEAAVAKLRALGYMAYRAPVSQESLQHPLADPKDKLVEFNSILHATDAIDAGHFQQADALLTQLRRDDPAMYILPFMQGEMALRQQQGAAAVQYFQDCLKLAPNFDQAMTGLAGALEAQKRPQEAIEWLQRALERNPRNFRAWYQIGWIQERGGDHASAAENLEKALAIQPSFAPAWRDLGMLQYARQDYAAAAASLQKAADLKLNDPTLFNYLGICYSRTNRLPLAVRSYQQALKLKPAYAEAHLNLGFVYQRLNQPAAARREYSATCRLDLNLCKLIPSQ
ncbi:MAG TPA: sulfatase-like hydrolase/transferase [Terriglobales bacterium]|nr:sulfatase-like hydrolase/transferase [Terriglobales bacterium]